MSVFTLWALLVILLIAGLYWLVLRVFSVRNFDLGFKFRNATPEARQLANLSAAFVALMAGGLWIVAWATAQFTESWGILLLVLGVYCLIRGLRSKPAPKP